MLRTRVGDCHLAVLASAPWGEISIFAGIRVQLRPRWLTQGTAFVFIASCLMIVLFRIGFFTVSLVDLLDVVIVGYLIYVLYQLLKGSIAFNIGLGIVAMALVYWLVRVSGMTLLSGILEQIASLGFFVLIVVFQAEIRRFLMFLGRNVLATRTNFLRQWLPMERLQSDQLRLQEAIINKIVTACEQLASTHTGALIVFVDNPELFGLNESGVLLNSNVSSRLIISIFHKESPVHDGAMIVTQGKIYSVGAILPVSERQDLPPSAGLRHRAAVGLSESTNGFAVIVSEESGTISIADKGRLYPRLDRSALHIELRKRLIPSAQSSTATS